MHVLLEDRLKEEEAYDLAAILAACREPFELRCVCCNKRVKTTKGCAKRWCPVCGPKVTATRYARVELIARRMEWPLAVMLSIKNPKAVQGCVVVGSVFSLSQLAFLGYGQFLDEATFNFLYGRLYFVYREISCYGSECYSGRTRPVFWFFMPSFQELPFG